jgi:hypothetical protein
MQRRNFLAASLASSALAVAQAGSGQAISPGKPREFYQLRRYHLQNGPQTRLTEAYFANALVPALTRMGFGPIGAFRLEYGPETPAFYLLIPAASVEALTMIDLHLAEDSAFLSTAASFWEAPAAAPAFLRVESSLLAAFTGWPRLTPPPGSGSGSGAKATRIFQLRTYESPSDRDHVRKVEMFNSGEFQIFVDAGAHPVFFGDTLVGPRLPNLTYMLSFADLAELDASWKRFVADPAWKKLSTSPRYAYEEIVSNISNLILSPLASSQI